MASAPAVSTSSLMATMDEDDMPADQQQCVMALREGKRLLKEQHGSSAMVRFEKALMLSKSLGEKIYERRANRGLAAASRLQVTLPLCPSNLLPSIARLAMRPLFCSSKSSGLAAQLMREAVHGQSGFDMHHAHEVSNPLMT